MALSVHFSYSSVENPTVCEDSWNFRTWSVIQFLFFYILHLTQMLLSDLTWFLWIYMDFHRYLHHHLSHLPPSHLAPQGLPRCWTGGPSLGIFQMPNGWRRLSIFGVPSPWQSQGGWTGQVRISAWKQRDQSDFEGFQPEKKGWGFRPFGVSDEMEVTLPKGKIYVDSLEQSIFFFRGICLFQLRIQRVNRW